MPAVKPSIETGEATPADPLLASSAPAEQPSQADCGSWCVGNEACRSFWLSPVIRFLSDFGGILTYYLVASVFGYKLGALCGGVVASFGVLTDWIRSRFYDPWFRFPKPLDSGECVLYFVMFSLASVNTDALFWYNAIQVGGILVVLLVADACGYNVMVDALREHPKIPREVWNEDNPRHARERAELEQYAKSQGQVLAALLATLTVLSATVPLWSFIAGSRPDEWIRQLFNYWLQIIVTVAFVFELRQPRLCGTPVELSDATKDILASGGMGGG